MTSSLGYMELCRLCLVKDKVTVPIFGDTNDVRQIFLKITACLPVKVSRDDNLPKKICDSCLYKIDLLYQFWNTTINAEKQLIQWLNEIGVDAKNVDASLQMLPQSHAHPHAMQEEIMMKEERIESETKDGGTGFPNLYTEFPYQNPENNFDTPPVVEEATPAKRKTRGRPAGKKKAKVIIPESDDEDSIGSDRLANDDTNDSDSDGGKIAKQEADSDEDYVDNPESLEPTTFVDVPSAADAEQPGPSGLSKPATITAGTSDQGCNVSPDQLDYFAVTSAANEFVEILGQDGKIVRNYLCPWCPQTFTHRQEFINHGVARHVTLNSFSCLICDNGFKSQTALNLHMSVHNDGRAYCKVCHQEFITKASVQEHAKNYPPEKDFNCTNCKAIYHTDMQLQAHIEKEHQTEYRCFSCEELFEDATALSVHVVTHNGDSCTKFQCKYCGKLHNTRRQQRHHVDMKHLRKEQRVCEFCGKILATNMTFKEHLRTHTGEKPEICNKCGKSFRRKVTLLNHFLTHTGEKPHQCTHCEKSFTQRHTLVIHLRTHTGERPYECSICGEKFASLQPMKLHKKAKHNMLQF